MKKIYYYFVLFIFLGLIIYSFRLDIDKLVTKDNQIEFKDYEDEEYDEFPSSKEMDIELKSDQPNEFIKYFKEIATRSGENKPGYRLNYRIKELKKAIRSSDRNQKKSSQARITVGEVTSRGPGNVGGRTRAIIVDPSDETYNTWFAGAASGGIWKTTDGGEKWINLTPDLPNLSTNSIAMAQSNTDVMYVGTGELFAGNYTFVRGDGIFKTINKGETWQQIESTAGKLDFNSVNRIVINPSDENVVVVCTNTGIFKSTNGGDSWVKTYNSFGNSVQDLVEDPSDFNIQYAGVNSDGIYKSVNGGSSWVKSSAGIAEGERFEIAVSPNNPSKVYTSTYNSSDETFVYKSFDKGVTWAVASLPDGVDGNYLGEQGWYDNTITVHPYNEDVVFVGGVYIGKYTTTDNVSLDEPSFTGVDLENTQSFLNFVSFSASEFNGQLEIGDGSNPSEEFFTVEIRFGSGMSQKAHRFTVPATSGANGNGGAGVQDNEYSYQDYVEVPFEVWDVDNNRQLMVSFRDQQKDNEFNLNSRDDDSDPDLLTAREYLFIHNIEYAETPAENVINGEAGHLYKNMYFFWPILASGGTFPPTGQAIMRINFDNIAAVEATASIVSDPRGDFGGINDNLHADHHNLTMIPIDEQSGEFRILNGNDGGIGISMNGGTTWKQITDGYVTTQFYGADKMPGEDEYIGGMQDNGTWRSPSRESADNTTQFNEVLGGDGFEVIWHAQNPDKLMGSIYNNRIYRSTTGGKDADAWSAAQNGINTTEGPFITRLASSRTSPDVVFAVSSRGILKTGNFGEQWRLVEIVDNWTFTDANSIPQATSQHDVKVSLSNDQIVWAGGGMADGIRKMFVSTDGGENFNPVADYPDAGLGALSGIATHPTEDSTAFALFSFANSPKVLRTKDLGQTWQDISGFNTNESTSSNGFPDVFVHSLLVMPNDPDVIWAGTEIGLFESIDNGESWSYADIGLPAVSIWTMKVVDDQVVIGTHGRGIWSVTISELLNSQLLVKNGEYVGNRSVSLQVDLPVAYDALNVYINNELVDVINEVTADTNTINVNIEATGDSTISLYLEGVIDDITYKGSSQNVKLDFTSELTSFTQDNNNLDQLNLIADITEEYDSIQFYLNDQYVGSTTDISLGELSASYTIAESGDYETYIIGYYNETGFESETIDLTVRTITSTSENATVNFNLFPNPVENVLNFEVPDKFREIYMVRIMDSKGQVVYSTQLNKYVSLSRLGLSGLTKGVYILNLSDGNHSLNQRFIKQ